MRDRTIKKDDIKLWSESDLDRRLLELYSILGAEIPTGVSQYYKLVTLLERLVVRLAHVENKIWPPTNTTPYDLGRRPK
jgi:hypothetical protein